MEFPKWKYHATKPAVIVKSAAEEAALGKGWTNNPSVIETPKEEEKPAEAPKK